MEYFLAISNIVLIAAVCVMLIMHGREKKDLVSAMNRILGEHLDPLQNDPVHLSVGEIMDILRVEGYVPERSDEKTVDFRKEGILYRVSYESNRMDLCSTFTMGKLTSEEREDASEICRSVSEGIIMADAVLEGPDRNGDSAVTFKISMMLVCRDEFAESFMEYLDIIDELHARFVKEYQGDDDRADSSSGQSDSPDAVSIPVSSRSKLLN